MNCDNNSAEVRLSGAIWHVYHCRAHLSGSFLELFVVHTPLFVMALQLCDAAVAKGVPLMTDKQACLQCGV